MVAYPLAQGAVDKTLLGLVVTDNNCREGLVGAGANALRDHTWVCPAVAGFNVKFRILGILRGTVIVNGESHRLKNTGIFVMVEIVITRLLAKGDTLQFHAQFLDCNSLLRLILEATAAGDLIAVILQEQIVSHNAVGGGNSTILRCFVYRNGILQRPLGLVSHHHKGAQGDIAALQILQNVFEHFVFLLFVSG